MNRYTIYCTPEQTKKALELGAPIRFASINDIRLGRYIETECDKETYEIPTAVQMVGWLNIEKKIFVEVRPYVSICHEDKYDSTLINLCNGHMLNVKQGCNNSKEATLAAIDVALEYLTNNKK